MVVMALKLRFEMGVPHDHIRIAGPRALRRTRGLATSASGSNRNEAEVEDVGVAASYLFENHRLRRAIEVDVRSGGLRALEHDVLGFLDVDMAAAQALEDVGQNARLVAMPDDEGVRRGRLPREVDDVWSLAGVLERDDH